MTKYKYCHNCYYSRHVCEQYDDGWFCYNDKILRQYGLNKDRPLAVTHRGHCPYWGAREKPATENRAPDQAVANMFDDLLPNAPNYF
jgi:hypothetical protein